MGQVPAIEDMPGLALGRSAAVFALRFLAPRFSRPRNRRAASLAFLFWCIMNRGDK
jgi:hypothetical protein